jgi:hypothetical protein
MERYAELISVLLQHSQKFIDFWNIQIVILLAILGFVFSNPEAVSNRFFRLTITLVIAFIALFSAFSLSVHQERQEKLFSAIESRFMLMSDEFTTQELEYIDTLKPTSYWLKIGALVLADMFVIAVIWINPRNRQKIEKVKKG